MVEEAAVGKNATSRRPVFFKASRSLFGLVILVLVWGRPVKVSNRGLTASLVVGHTCFSAVLWRGALSKARDGVGAWTDGTVRHRTAPNRTAPPPKNKRAAKQARQNSENKRGRKLFQARPAAVTGPDMNLLPLVLGAR